ncbi:leucine-rich repeat protein [Brachyspira intermedia]|uniref:leucine-rich repeat protein n=1 Tax=Brachyspira intermedia TaxID=84377 RepID=UPI0030076315
MKKAIILLFIFFILLSCKYKITSPKIQYECSTDNTGDAGDINNNLYTVGANSTEEEIRTALENNKGIAGKNIIVVTGYIDNSSKIFDNIKTVIQNEKDIILDLSGSNLNTDNKFTLNNITSLITILLPNMQKIIANFLSGCTSLINIQIPNGIYIVDNSCFNKCTSIKNIEYLGTSAKALSAGPFADSKPTDLYLPNVSSDPGDSSWDNFLGVAWVNIHYGASMPK